MSSASPSLRAAACARAVVLVLAALAVLMLAAPAAGSPGSATVLVKFSPSATDVERAAVLGSVGVTVEQTLRRLDVIVATVAVDVVQGVVARLASSPLVEYAEPDARAAATAASNDPAQLAWNFTVPHLYDAWNLTRGSAAIKVAVLDSGVDPTQPDLQGALGEGYNAIDGGSWVDGNGHGTEVAGTLAARADNAIGSAGVCPHCTIMPVKVLDGAPGVQATGSWSDVASGIVWATDHGARIINMSLTGTSFSNTLDQAVTYAQSRGVLLVAAAGNSGSTTPEYPAGLTGVIGVAASDANDNRYSFSNYGTTIPLAAPGCVRTSMISASYGDACGTSFASPYVAGVAALTLAYDALLTADDVARALRGGATPVAGDWVTSGRVDALATLLQVGGEAPAAPTNVSPPSIVGTPVVGSTLTASPGSWTGNPISYGYAWSRCAGVSDSCSSIPGAVSPEYRVTASDLGTTLEVTVTATSPAGAKAASVVTEVVTAGHPSAGPSAPASTPTGGSSDQPAADMHDAPAPSAPTMDASQAPTLRTSASTARRPKQAPAGTSGISTPLLGGSARVGGTIYVRSGLGTVIVSQWQIRRNRGWIPIRGATKRSLRIAGDVAGHRVRAVLTIELGAAARRRLISEIVFIRPAPRRADATA